MAHKVTQFLTGFSGEEVSELDTLEGQLRMVTDKFRCKRKLIKELQQELQTMSNTLQSLNADNSEYSSKTDEAKVSRGHVNCIIFSSVSAAQYSSKDEGNRRTESQIRTSG